MVFLFIGRRAQQDRRTQTFALHDDIGGAARIMRKYSYESILRAVGQVLDEADVKGFAIHDDENGLVVRTRGADGEPSFTVTFGLADLVALLDQKALVEAPQQRERRYDEGTLSEFLGRRELVAAG